MESPDDNPYAAPQSVSKEKRSRGPGFWRQVRDLTLLLLMAISMLVISTLVAAMLVFLFD